MTQGFGPTTHFHCGVYGRGFTVWDTYLVSWYKTSCCLASCYNTSCYQIHGILLATKYVTNTWKKSKNRRACPSINQTRGNQFVMLYSIWITFMLADILSVTRYLFLFCRILSFMLLFWIFVLLDITNMLPQIHKWLVRYYKIVSVSWYIFC